MIGDAGGSLRFDPATGHWVAERYDVARAVLSDAETFGRNAAAGSVRQLPAGAETCTRLGQLLEAHATIQTPSGHRLVQQALPAVLGKQAVEGMRPQLTARIRGLVERRAGAGRLDVVADIEVPLSREVACVLSGWAEADEAWMLSTADLLAEIASAGEPPSLERCLSLEERLHRFDACLGGDRPPPELGRVVGALVGSGLGPALSVAVGLLLPSAGVFPLGAAVARSVALLTEEDLWDEAAAADPRLVDELLRYASPVGELVREATRPCTIGSSSLTTGDRVILSLARANRDGGHFDDPEAFLPDRAPNNHLAFGAGTYRCQGAHLAREVLAILLRELRALGR